MAWPKGKPRKAVFRELPPIDAELTSIAVDPERAEPEPPQYPADWRPGMLLNVRNTGPDYTITLWPEEADPRDPERALHFTNPGECQNFVSLWYSRQSHDPRAR
jgi:hypothetical protein